MEFQPWFYEPEAGVFYLNAGDTHPSKLTRDYFDGLFGENYFSVMGNHDYYKGTFNTAEADFDMIEVDGIKIAGATLWTDLSNPVDWNLYQSGLADSRYIQNLNQDSYMNAHKIHKEFLLTSDADVIVSHHAPSYLSISARYKGDAYNPCFVTELYENILNMKKLPKLWIHGHTHNRSDYMIGDTRVICHPRGYPNENTWYNSYRPLIVEIN